MMTPMTANQRLQSTTAGGMKTPRLKRERLGVPGAMGQ